MGRLLNLWNRFVNLFLTTSCIFENRMGLEIGVELSEMYGRRIGGCSGQEGLATTVITWGAVSFEGGGSVIEAGD